MKLYRDVLLSLDSNDDDTDDGGVANAWLHDRKPRTKSINWAENICS